MATRQALQDAANMSTPTACTPRKRRSQLAKETSDPKFDATVEVHLRIGVDPRHADQQVRGTVVLPHGLGKVPRRSVRPGRWPEALRCRRRRVGGRGLVKQIEGGWLEFDVAIATPDPMGQVGRLGRILGRRASCRTPRPAR